MRSPGPLHALFAEATAVPPDERELAWYRQHLPADEGLVLDVACGIGRVLVALVAGGLKAHGVEPAPALLDRCTARLAAAGVATTTFRQETAHLNLPFRYAGAYVADGALQTLSDPAEVEATLTRLRAHLVTPGTLVVDCRVPALSLRRLAAPLVEVRTAKLPDGTQIALRSESTWTSTADGDDLPFAPEGADAAAPWCAGWHRAERRYAHRRGAQRLAEEHEVVRAAWYAPEHILACVRAAGYRDARVMPSPAGVPDAEGFALIARA